MASPRSGTLALVGVLLGVLVGTAGPAQAADADCSDFATQADAQAFYLAHGGPAADPHRLDADGDGLACESLPCPCSDPAPPPPPPAPPPCSRRTKVVEKAVVVTVVDGDTLRVRLRGKRATIAVRLLGINAPERKQKGYASATSSLRRLTPPRKTITMSSDPTQAYRDRYGRALRYISRSSQDVNKIQLTRGWARYFDVKTCAPLSRKVAYRAAERAAKQARRGIWR